MSNRDDEAARRVRFVATLAAVARACRTFGPALLMAWTAILVVRGVPWVLQLNHIAVPPLPYGPLHWSTTLPTVAATTLVCGVLTRWLLAPTRASLRVDWRLAVYVGLLVLAYVAPKLVTYWLVSLPPVVSSLADVLILLALALFALWPIAILTGEAISIGAAAACMRQAYRVYVVFYLLSGLPADAFLGIGALIGHGAMRTAARLLVYAAVSTIATTLMAVVLAQIYSRRVRGRDLDSPA